MYSPIKDCDVRSDPSRFETSLDERSSPRTPLKSKRNTNTYELDQSGGGSDVVSSIISDRVCRSSKYTDNPHHVGSSPLTPRDKSELRVKEQQNKSRNQRMGEREKRSINNRGGLARMEEFVMKGERKMELEQMTKLAEDNAIPEDMIDNFEENYTAVDDIEESSDEDGNDDNDDDDDDLIRYFEDKEKYEKELEQLLSELSMT